MLLPALIPATVGEGVGVSRSSQIIAHGQSGGYAGGATAVAGGWSKGGFTISQEAVNVSRPGVPVMKFLMPAGAVDQYVVTRIKIPRTALSGRFDLRLWFPPVTAGALYMEFRYSSDTPAADPPSATPTNRRFMNIQPDQMTKGKWTTISFHPSGKLFSNSQPNGVAWSDTGSPDPAQIEYLELVLGCTAATPDAERYMLLDYVAINGYRKPFVILGADGFGTPSHSSYLLPALGARGFRGYIAGDGNLATGQAAFLSTWYAAGNDVVSEGMNHTDYSANPSLLSGDYDTARGILDGLGFTRASKWFAYPVAGISQTTIATLDGKGVKAARASSHPKITISELGNSDFTTIGSFGSDQKTSTQTKSWLDEVILSGTGMMLFGHDFVASPSLSTETSIASFDIFLDYLKSKVDAGLVDVITPQDFENRYT